MTVEEKATREVEARGSREVEAPSEVEAEAISDKASMVSNKLGESFSIPVADANIA